MASLILHGATLVTLGTQCQVIPEAALWVEDGRIRSFGPSAELLEQAGPVQRIDLGGKILLPGLINSHNHLYSAFARGIALKDEAPQNFLEILQRLWWRLDQALTHQDCFLSALLGFSEALSRGVTTVVDHHASPNCIRGSLEQLARAALQVGIRACLCYETSDRHGEQGALEGIEENLRFAREVSHPRLASALGLHASITVSPQTLARALKRWPEDIPIHVHVAEDHCDVDDSLRNYSKPPLQRLFEEGLRDRAVWAAHCIHLQPHEAELLAHPQHWVLHNPRSNMNNAVGCAPVGQMLANGLSVALGTDGMSADPAQDARTLAWLHKHQAGHPQAFSFADIYRVTFLEPARLASARFGRPLGELRVGAEADLCALDYDPPTPLTTSNFLGHWLFGMSTAPCWGTWVAGECVYLKGQVAGVDLPTLKEHCRQAAQSLWNRW